MEEEKEAVKEFTDTQKFKALCISYVPELQATSKPHPGPIGS
jgi:hypothetical protein